MSTQVLTVDQPRPLVNWSKLGHLWRWPALAALSILTLLGMIIWMSLRTGVPGQPSAYTLKNYTALLGDSYTYRVMMTTLIFAAVTIAVSVPLGFIFAWFIERTDIPYKAVAMSVLSIGILFPTFLKAMGWVFLLHPRIGVINIFLMQLFGLTNAPLNIATLPGIGFVQGMTLTPLAYVMISAALRSMNPALVEAASVHGVSQVAHACAHRAAAHLAGVVLGRHLDAYGGDRRLRRARRDRHGQQYFYLQHRDLLHDQSQRRVAALRAQRRLRHASWSVFR